MANVWYPRPLDTSFDVIVKRDLRNLYDNKFFEALSYIYLEGSATYVGYSDNEISKTENIKKGLDIINSIYEKLYKEKNLDEAENLLNSGLISNGPFYSLGYYITSNIVNTYGSNGSYHNLLDGTISFYKKYFDCYNKNIVKSDMWYGSKIAEKIKETPEYGLRILGFIDATDNENGAGSSCDVKLMGNLGDLETILRDEVVDQVFVTLPIKSYY